MPPFHGKMTVPALQEVSSAAAASERREFCKDETHGSSKEPTSASPKTQDTAVILTEQTKKLSEHRRAPSLGSASEFSEASVDCYTSDGEADTDAVMLDHAYASTNTCVDESCFDVSDLSSLIENCELDTKFIESAASDTANFQHFLDDVINDCDVPADDIVLGLLDDAPRHVPTKSSCLHALSVPGGSLFSCARGSTETRLCASVVSPTSSPGWGFGTNSSPPLATSFPKLNCSSTLSSASLDSAFQTSSASDPSMSMTSSFPSLSTVSLNDVMSYSDAVLSEEKIKDLLDWLSSGNNCSSLSELADDLCPSPLALPSGETKLNDLGRAQDYCSSCLSVSVSHQIRNGVCLHCSAGKTTTDINRSAALGHSFSFSSLLSSTRTPVADKCFDCDSDGKAGTSPKGDKCDKVINPIASLSGGDRVDNSTPINPSAVSGKRKSVSACSGFDTNTAEGPSSCKKLKVDGDSETHISDAPSCPQAGIQSAESEPKQDSNNNITDCVLGKDSDDSEMSTDVAGLEKDSHMSKINPGDMMGFLSQLSTGIPSDTRSW